MLTDEVMRVRAIRSDEPREIERREPPPSRPTQRRERSQEPVLPNGDRVTLSPEAQRKYIGHR